MQASLGTKSGSESQGHARRALRNEHNFILIEILEFIPHGLHGRYQHNRSQHSPNPSQSSGGLKSCKTGQDVNARASFTTWSSVIQVPNDIGTCTVLLGASCGCISVWLQRRSQPALLASRHNNCLSVSIPQEAPRQLEAQQLPPWAAGIATASLLTVCPPLALGRRHNCLL